MRELPHRTVEVALTSFPPAGDAVTAERCLALLDEEETARYHRFLPPEKRFEFLVTHALVRTQLSEYADVRPEAWKFTANKHGRPEVASPMGKAPHFNLSNTRGLVACAFASTVDVGVDVENLSLKRATTEIADRFFSPQEVADLHALPVDRQHDRFFDYWTLKESYIKARGMGLAIPLEKFSFRFEGGSIRIELDPSLGDDADSWQFWLSNPLPGYRMAVAVRRTGIEPFALTERWVPAAPR